MIDFRLGLRFARSTAGRGRTRSALVIGANALGVFLLMGVLALSTMPLRQQVRSAGLIPLDASPRGTGDNLLMRAQDLFTWNGQSTVITDVAPGRGSLLPPGVTVLPRPGEMVVSPRLAELLRQDSVLRSALPGRVVGKVGRSGLVEPRQLAVYRGAVAGAGFSTVDGFGIERGLEYNSSLSDADRLTLVVILFLVLPLFVLTASAARLSSSTRDRRLAALRLMGLTARRSRRIAAVEAAVLSIVGIAVGVSGFFALRPLAEHVHVRTYSWFGADLLPLWWETTLVVVAVPVLSVLVSLAPAWRLSWFPLRARRATGDVVPTAARVLPLAGGLALLGMVLRGVHPQLDSGDSLFRSTSFLLGLLFMAVGLGLLVPLALRSSAVPMRGQSSSPALRRVARPLMVERTVSAKAGAGFGLLLLMLGAAVLAADYGSDVYSEDGEFMSALMAAGIVLTALGLVLAVPWLLHAGASRAAGRTRSPLVRLAARRIETEPSTTTRVIGGLLVAVFVCSFAQSVLVAFDRTPQHLGAVESARTTAAQTVLLEDFGDRKVKDDEIAETPGVTAVTEVHLLREVPPCASPQRKSRGCVHAIVATCAELAIVRPTITGCRDGVPFWVGAQFADAGSELLLSTTELYRNKPPVNRIRVRAVAPELVVKPIGARASGPLDEETGLSVHMQERVQIFYALHLVLPPLEQYERALGDGPQRFQVDFIGGLNTLSRISLTSPGVLVQSQSVGAFDLSELIASTKYRAVLWTVTAIGLVIAFGALAITGVDHALERRSRTARLQAFGTPPSMLRRSQFLHLFVPGAFGVVLAGVIGLYAGTAYLNVDGKAAYAPVREVVVVLVCGLVAAALTALAPLRAATAPIRADDLRRE